MGRFSDEMFTKEGAGQIRSRILRTIPKGFIAISHNDSEGTIAVFWTIPKESYI